MTHRTDLYDKLSALAGGGVPCVLVILVEAIGSTPQDTGAKMLVTTAGLQAGTVGGGRVEAKAVALAQDMLQAGESAPRLVQWSLRKDVGMTCGGSVKLYLEPHPGSGVGGTWPVWIFGAGHVVQALVPVLAPLECSLTVVDPRQEWLDRLPPGRNVRRVCHPQPEELVPEMPEGTFVLCLTKGHTSDLPILRRALAERAFPFLGVIGSAAKAAVLRRDLVAAGIPAERAGEFHCPVGLEFGSNHPHEIALSIAAQLLTERDRLRARRRLRSRGAAGSP